VLLGASSGSGGYKQTCHLIAVTIFCLHGLVDGRFQEVSDSNAFSFPAVQKENVRSVGCSSHREAVLVAWLRFGALFNCKVMKSSGKKTLTSSFCFTSYVFVTNFSNSPPLDVSKHTMPSPAQVHSPHDSSLLMSVPRSLPPLLS